MTVQIDDRMPIPREIPFDFPDDIDTQWIPDKNELAAMFNGASLTMPYLEPFLIRTMAEAARTISDPTVKETVRAFNAQEGQHFQTHRRFNELLKSKRYPELADTEAEMEASYKRLNKKSLRLRLAYTAGFEAMTLGVTKWLIEDRTCLFHHADSRVASFVLWHMVEETEHKCVAYDAYKDLYPRGFGNYIVRAIGVLHGSFDVMRFSRRAYIKILKRERLWQSLRPRLRLYGELINFVRHVGPYLLRATLPGHNPRQERDPDWVTEWLDLYEDAPKDKAPLIDTFDPAMPVPFIRPAGSTATHTA